jgi:predicted porin
MKHLVTRIRPVAIRIGLIGFCGALVAPAAVAGEIDDLKATIGALQKRIEQIEKQAADAKVAEVQAAPTASAASASAPATGLTWKFYGRADLGYVSSTGMNAAGQKVTTRRLNQGEMASRLGISGAWVFNEDYKALFAAETGINLYNGNAGGGTQNNTSGSVFFNRGATAGLSATHYGSIEGGTMYMAPFWVMLGADLASAHDYGANDFSALFSMSRPEALGRYLKDPVTGNVSGTSSLTGANSGTALFYGNALRYRTPAFDGTLKGLSAEISFSMGQQASGATPLREDGRTYAGNVTYNSGPLFVGYAHMDYEQVNDVATSGASNWQQRNQVTDIVGARYRWLDLTVGASYTSFRVSNAGGYKAQAYGLSGAYDIGKHRIEASVANVSYSGANSSGAYGRNLGDGIGDPSSTDFGIGYLYNLQKNLSLYAYYNKIINNEHAKLGVLQFRNDNQYFGYDPSEWTVGMFYTF